jgi:DNA-binding GntR family transcriptional regulator
MTNLSTLPAAGAQETGAAFLTKSQGVYEELRRWILCGKLEPGQRLDQEWLAEALKVSRMPLRQALLRLEADGLVESQPHRGAIVSPLSLKTIEDVYASRIALEGMLAYAGALRGNEDLWNAMDDSIQLQKDAIARRDILRYVKIDRDFHMLLYAASGYERSNAIVSRLREISDRYVLYYARYRSGASKSLKDHHKILAECRSRNAKAVRKLIIAHTQRGLTALNRIIGDKESPPTADPGRGGDLRLGARRPVK